MKRLSRITALLLAALMLLPALVACGEDTPAVTTGPSITTDVPVTTDAPEEKPNIPESLDYDGHDFVVFIAGNMPGNDFEVVDASDIISDAIFRRNSLTESTFDIKISNIDKVVFNSCTGSGTGYTEMYKLYTSGSYDYDIGIIGTYDVSTLATAGALTDLKSIDGIDTTRSWWDQKANEQLTVKGTLFYTTGDIILTDNVFTNCIMFNKGLIKEHSDMVDPYTLVRDDKWTYETLGAEVKKISEDVDANDVMDQNDRYGLLTWKDAMMAAYSSSGAQIATVDSNGDIVLTVGSERALAAMEAYADFAFDPKYTYNYQYTSGLNWDEVRFAIFDQNRAAYYMTGFNTVTKHRDMETDFGILPYPKLDGTQEEYANLVCAFHTGFLCVPFHVEDIERTGYIVEFLAYAGKKILTPAYYEKTLVGRVCRDEESIEMLDIIFATHLYDIGLNYKLGGYSDIIIDLPQVRSLSRFTSSVERLKKPASKKIEEINQKYAEYANAN